MSKDISLLNGLVSLSASRSLSNVEEFAVKAQQELTNMSLPTQKDEDWKYTSLRDLAKHTFVKQAACEFAFDSISFVEADYAAVVTFVNGLLDSVVNSDNVDITSLADVTDTTLLAEIFSKDEVYQNDVFANLNSATVSDGIVISIKKSQIIEKPIYIRHICCGGDDKIVQSPRIFVKAEVSSSVNIIEDFVSVNEDSVYLSVPYSRYILEKNAHVVHVKLQRESKKAFHISRIVSDLHKDSHYESYTVNIGSKLCRNDVAALQREDAINCTLDGLVLLNGDQVSDTHTVMDHKMPWGESHQLHKVVADDHSQSIFNGKIFVRQDAQKTNSFQENRSLMLSQTATIDSKPQLEIFADDVKCSHGATIGQLEDEHLFYLKSRGLPQAQAVQLLTYAFAAEVVEKIPLDVVKPLIIKAVEQFTKFHQEHSDSVEV